MSCCTWREAAGCWDRSTNRWVVLAGGGTSAAFGAAASAVVGCSPMSWRLAVVVGDSGGGDKLQ
jgi:hypothetical protein